MSVKPLFSDSDIEKWVEVFRERAERALFVQLQAAGEMFVKYARESGQYTDRTGNLRSSIGYIIVHGGNVLSENFDSRPSPERTISEEYTYTLKSGEKKTSTRKVKVGGSGEIGFRKAKRLAQELASRHRHGFILIGVAGMEYAAHVEAMEGKDVIIGASIKTEEWLRDSIRTILKKGHL
jgi:hypothetical protein